jgi:hypothetical protein
MAFRKKRKTTMSEDKAFYTGGGRITAKPPADPSAIAEHLDVLSEGRMISALEKLLDQTVRDEANAIVAFAFRNGQLENLHAGEYSADLIENPNLSRITDAEMKQLMLFACEAVEKALRLRDENPEAYSRFIAMQQSHSCGDWQR